mmetsp:Transcript_51774/g.161104  ORF Transcript_51774/g.161104 Transcript_51774/m.161104 type:complete len:114 (-) Transcript_51774:271-612(-)
MRTIIILGEELKQEPRQCASRMWQLKLNLSLNPMSLKHISLRPADKCTVKVQTLLAKPIGFVRPSPRKCRRGADLEVESRSLPNTNSTKNRIRCSIGSLLSHRKHMRLLVARR